MSDAPLFRARAEECRTQAEESSLQNVKERCLRAAAAWEAMAARARRTDTMRAKQIADKEAAQAEHACAPRQYQAPFGFEFPD